MTRRSIYVPLEESTLDGLTALARAQGRSPKDQAAAIIAESVAGGGRSLEDELDAFFSRVLTRVAMRLTDGVPTAPGADPSIGT